jgi:hypothetical protein
MKRRQVEERDKFPFALDHPPTILTMSKVQERDKFPFALDHPPTVLTVWKVKKDHPHSNPLDIRFYHYYF